MRKIALSYQLSAQRERDTLIRNQLMDLLQAVRSEGSISAAARKLGLSYRHVWGLLKEWELTIGQPLIVWERGQSAQLTPFADKLLWTERLAQARLAPKIEALRADLEGQARGMFCNMGTCGECFVTVEALGRPPQVGAVHRQRGQLGRIGCLHL